ncbi:MAG: FAD-dependent oxidoreductase, partial [Hyphomicrobium sp.]|nr:FAD-dependent oxidoreductase [Hyphomicrobium sp.]
MAEIWQGVKSVRDEGALAVLARRARHDLEMLNYPPSDWVPEVAGPDGKPMLDALIVGGGMCGQTAAFALRREGVRKIRVIDRCARGDEGPWGTYARMEILRSPKHLTGPDLGVPSLTFRAWYEAQHGEDGWAQLYKV